MGAPCRRAPRKWSSIHRGEDSKAAAHRQRLAVVACRRCPVLDACGTWLEEQELNGIKIDGIVAGRQWRARKNQALDR